MVSSDVLELEISKSPYSERRDKILGVLKLAVDRVEASRKVRGRGEQLVALGFGAFDALHIACAEAGKADIMLTTDARLLRRAVKHRDLLRVRIANPVDWLVEVEQ